MQHQKNKIDSFLARAFQFGYKLTQTAVSEILCEADDVLCNSAES